MSDENTKLIRRAFDLLNAGDVEGAKDMADAEIELRTRFTGVAGRAYRGHQGVDQWFSDVSEAWEDVIQTPKRFIEIDDERTIVVVGFHARGKASGVVVDQEIAPIWTIRDGKIVGIETLASLDEALEAAGLSE